MSDAEDIRSVSESYSDESQLIERIDAYLHGHVCSPEAALFEKEIEQAVVERLEGRATFGWDFDIRYPFFGDRGVSILIQNLELDGQAIWQWLEQHCSAMPSGAILNFEVQDRIQGRVMKFGATICRRVATSVGIWEKVG